MTCDALEKRNPLFQLLLLQRETSTTFPRKIALSQFFDFTCRMSSRMYYTLRCFESCAENRLRNRKQTAIESNIRTCYIPRPPSPAAPPPRPAKKRSTTFSLPPLPPLTPPPRHFSGRKQDMHPRGEEREETSGGDGGGEGEGEE